MFSKITLSSKIVVAALLVLLLFLGDLKFRQWKDQKQIEQQQLSLQKQADDLQKQNDELNQSLQYLNSQDFKERVAREQLGLKRDGEEVYTFDPAPQSGQQQAPQSNLNNNPKKWWDYFFGDD